MNNQNINHVSRNVSTDASTSPGMRREASQIESLGRQRQAGNQRIYSAISRLSGVAHSVVMFVVFSCLALPASAENVQIYFDETAPQLVFAAGDIRAALEKQKHTVEALSLSALTNAVSGKKIVLARATDEAVIALLSSQGGKPIAPLGAQAYALRTTTAPALGYWVIGGDTNGAMYGGLQIAENINFNQLTGSYDVEESPAIPKRGIKLNLPLDKESGTYGSSKASGAKNAILNVWDMTFWTSWFDEMARNRYNVVSVWSNHHFTSMIKLPEYPDVAIQDVTNFEGKKIAISIDEKIVFWKKVMSYAKSRGFDFYLVNWNIWTHGATGKYGITDDKAKAATDQATINYMRKCMVTLLETYPDIDGFGITAGEHMSENESENSVFLAKTYGLGMADFASRNPQRKLTFIHRWHLSDFAEIKKNFGELMSNNNVNFQMSFKYSLAHMYANPVPQRMSEDNVKSLKDNNLRSWLTVRNDDFYYHNWGDPSFARAYLNGMINRGDWFCGFYMGSDGFSPTRTFFSKSSLTQGKLEIQRQWYMFMLWGRLSYNPATADTVFKNYMGQKYPEVSSTELFSAWTKASLGLPKIGELITGTLGRDNQWWPEACQSDESFLTVADFSSAKSSKGSTLASIADTASGRLQGKKSALVLADEIEQDARAALDLVKGMTATPNTELGEAIDHIKLMSYLTVYYAHKIRGATYLKTEDKEKAKVALGSAYCWWIKYASLMDKKYTGMSMARSADLADWRAHDQSVLKEYSDLGGVGIPTCE